MKARTRYELHKLLFVVVYWIVASNLYVLVRHVGSPYTPSSNVVDEVISIQSTVLLSTVGGLLTGLLIGLLEIFIYPRILKKLTFGMSILSRTLVFFFIVITSISMISTIFYLNRDYTIFQTAGFTLDYYATESFLSLIIYLIVVSSVMDFILQVNKRLGPGIILNMLSGKYYRPREEYRIFMFIDLQSSSKTAEKIGHFNFSCLLQDCFLDLSSILMQYEGFVYQFVGDEAVVTWSKNKGLRGSNCYHLYHEFDKLLQSRKSYYNTKYGHMPVFKASINMGKVTVAEVGEIKSELAYHGDVLNTASRVQALCNNYSKKILVTHVVAEELKNDKCSA